MGRSWVRTAGVRGWGLGVGLVVCALLAGRVGFAGEGAAKADKAEAASREVFTLDVREADVREVLHLLSRNKGINMAVSDEVKGKVTVTARDVPLPDLLARICDAANLQYRVVGGVYVIEPKPKAAASPETAAAVADTLRKRLAELEAQRASAMAAGRTDTHPETVRLRAELNAVQERLAQAEAALAQARAGQVHVQAIASADIEAARAAVEQAKAGISIAQAEVEQQRVGLDIGAALLQEAEARLREVREKLKKGEASQADVRQEETQVSLARAALQRQKAEVEAAQAKVEQAHAALRAAIQRLELAQAAAVRLTLPGVGAVSEAQLLVPAAPLRKPVSLSAKDAKLEEVVGKLSQSAGIPITLHEAVPKDIQVPNAALYGVTLAEALHLLLGQAGLRAVPSADRKGIVIMPPNYLEVSRREGSTVSTRAVGGGPPVANPLADLVARRGEGEHGGMTPYLSDYPLLSKLFRQASSAAPEPLVPCAKCKTPLQPDWLFCPKCGAKNKRTVGKDWKFCPTCGKALTTGAGARTTTRRTTTRR